MQVPNVVTEKKNIIVEIVVLCAFLGAMYYAYSLMSEQSPVTTVSANQQLFGPNLTLLLKAVNDDHIVLNNLSFMDGEVVRQLQDFSEVILPNPKHGRPNPFIPN